LEPLSRRTVNAQFPIPTTQYAESDGLSIAYQVFGEGAQDLIVVPPIISHVELNWEYPAYARMLQQLAQTFRVIMFDKRGQGLSDRFEGVPTLEQRMDDMRDVMRAAGSRRAVLFAASEGGPMAALFTATFPELVERLVLYGSMARFTSAPDYPWRPTLEQVLQWTATFWGKPEAVRLWTPGRADDAVYCELVARYQRQSASPSAIKRVMIANDQIDVRAILPQVRRPTLVIQRRGDRAVTCANGRYLVDQIPDAVYLEVPGDSHFAAEGDADAIVDAVVHHATSQRAGPAADTAERWLATVLFTDIVDSTALVTRLGDRAWSELQQQFHAIGRTQLELHRGREIDTAGDGLFAAFDGPARAIRSAAAMVKAAESIGLKLRAGLHTGEVQSSGSKVSGTAVHVGARVMSLAGAGEILVSGTVKDLVAGSGITFEPRGAHALKGLPGEWHLHHARVELPG
jgi:pimeloyl-ACP methyl ester carboxylesterase/class 3 adenylate cyclase